MNRTTHNRKQRRKKERERARSDRDRKDRGGFHRILVVAVVVVSVLLLLAVYFRPTPSWNAPTSKRETAQHVRWGLLLQVGDANETAVVCPDGSRSQTCMIRIPNNFGVDVGNSKVYPLHTVDQETPRGLYFTVIHVESQYSQTQHRYTLDDFFEVWGRYMRYPGFVAFSQDRLVYYQGSVDVYVQRGPTGDAPKDALTATPRYDQQVGGYGAFSPRDGDLVTVVVHDGYTTLPTAW